MNGGIDNNASSNYNFSNIRSYMNGTDMDVNDDSIKVVMLPPKIEAKAASRKKTGKDINMSHEHLPLPTSYMNNHDNNIYANKQILQETQKRRNKKVTSGVQFSNNNPNTANNHNLVVMSSSNMDPNTAMNTKKQKKQYTRKNKIIVPNENIHINVNQQTSMAPPSITPFRGKKRSGKSNTMMLNSNNNNLQDSSHLHTLFSASSSSAMSTGLPSCSSLGYDNLSRNGGFSYHHGSGLTPELHNLGLLDQNFSFDKCDTPNFFDTSSSGMKFLDDPSPLNFLNTPGLSGGLTPGFFGLAPTPFCKY